MTKTIVSSVGGQLLEQLVAVGQTVTVDTEVAMVDSMKMHIPVLAEQAGRVARWLVDAGATVKEGQPLLALEG